MESPAYETPSSSSSSSSPSDDQRPGSRQMNPRSRRLRPPSLERQHSGDHLLGSTRSTRSREYQRSISENMSRSRRMATPIQGSNLTQGSHTESNSSHISGTTQSPAEKMDVLRQRKRRAQDAATNGDGMSPTILRLSTRTRKSTDPKPGREDGSRVGQVPMNSSVHSRDVSPIPSSRINGLNEQATTEANHGIFRLVPTQKPLDVSSLSFEVPLPHARFPSFKGCTRLNGFATQSEPQQFFDCKFYPYTEPGVDPVFAVVGGTKTMVARPAKTGKELLDVCLWLEEVDLDDVTEETQRYRIRGNSTWIANGRSPSNGKRPLQSHTNEPVELNSCVWLRSRQDKLPYLAVSGKPATIKIFDVTNERLHRTFAGHGKEVNDMAVSPRDSTIFASASGDHTVRIWSIDPKYDKQPCIAVCAGKGHRQALLTLAFHANGKYLLTGGVDCAICLWVLPDLPDERSGTDKPTTVHYPHFKSTAIHMSFVDCVAFYHDLILSKSAMENKIVLWRIEGFDSREEPPSTAPTDSKSTTTSAFGGKFQRLIQFEVNDTSSFYIRFSLFHYPDQRTILAIGNERSKIFFWDLQALADYMQPQVTADSAVNSSTRGHTPQSGKVRKIGRAANLGSFAEKSRHDSVQSEGSNPRSERSQHNHGFPGDSLGLVGAGRQKMAEKYLMDDPFKTLEPHKMTSVQRVTFACRQVAWSVGGEYMIVVGDQGMIGLFARDLHWR